MQKPDVLSTSRGLINKNGRIIYHILLIFITLILTFTCEKTDSEESSDASEHALVTITDGGEENWYVQFSQDIPAIQTGVLYDISFDAFASKDVRIYCDLNQAGGDYSGILPVAGISPFFNITTEEKTYTVSAVSTIDDDGDGFSQIQFNLGANGSYSIYFDNISVTADAVEQIVNGDFSLPITTGWNDLFLYNAEATILIVTL
ncbi:MAG: carbohydrate binding domain-containing protein [Bacteroidales bacterium]|nr:carbohydrate binding domain-containing protein [Bacteroidales bacterium]